MKLFVYGFWSGFIEKTNSVHIGFFQDLFQSVFNCEIILSNSVQESDILLETIFATDSQLDKKQWAYSFLFSGESKLNDHASKYKCILWGERNWANRINIPLFVPYLYCNDLIQLMQTPPPSTHIPPKNICAIITNPRGQARTQFLTALEKKIHIDYAGSYKNNVPRITHAYNTPEFRDAISQYKFIVSMENSIQDTYITEKITHGLLANTIPIYWGSGQVDKYFNPKRFINVVCSDNESLDKIIQNIVNICTNVDVDAYTNMVNQPNFTNNRLDRTLETIARDIRNHIFPRLYPSVNQIYIISNPEFEPGRYTRLCELFYDTLKISKDNIKFICPTYKQTITDELMTQSVSSQLVQRLRHEPMKKSEISLFYNYKAVLEDIVFNYKEGQFLIFESDVFAMENIADLNQFLEYAASKSQEWDLIHIGFGGETEIFESPYCMCKMPYRDELTNVNTKYIEDITTSENEPRMIRKYHTRCTDSFLWNYKGIQKFLHHMNTDTNYGAPFDYYMTNFLENHADSTQQQFKHYWTTKSYFLQGSNYGLEQSTIQGTYGSLVRTLPFIKLF